MSSVGLPLYGHCPYTRRTLADGSAVEEYGRGWATKSIISIQGEPSSERQSLFAGDREEETVYGPISGNMTAVLSRLPLKREAELSGAPYNEARDEMTEMGVPNPPYCRSGGIDKLLEDGEVYYQVIVYMSVKYGPVADNLQTATQTPAFQNKTLSGGISPNADNVSRVKRNFKGPNAFENALAYFYELLFIPAPMAMPSATPVAGEVEAGTAVTLAAATGAIIRYTTSGLDVTMANGMLYKDPIVIEETTILKARAYDPNEELSPSPQFAGTYTVPGDDAQTFGVTSMPGAQALYGEAEDAVRAELEGLTKDQLAALAAQSGYTVSKNQLKEDMVNEILELIMAEAVGDTPAEDTETDPDVEEG